MVELIKEIARIQKELDCPKSQYNKFGNYAYRSMEDITEAIKPLLKGLVLTVSDEIVNIGQRFYVKATARISDGTNSIENTAYAREEEDRKGMNAAQITGASSSYARKYALNGLFLIDDARDADATNDHGKAREDKGTVPIEEAKPLKGGEREVLVNKLNDLLVNNSLSLANVYDRLKLSADKRVDVQKASLQQLNFLIGVIEEIIAKGANNG